MATTLLQLRTSVRQQTDNVNSLFVSDAELTSYIHASYQEMYGLVVQAYGTDYYMQSAAGGFTITTDGINQTFALPTDFFKLLGVDLQISGSQYRVSLKPFTFAERNAYNIVTSLIPSAGQVVRVYYVPRPTLPTADADTIDGVNGWEELVIVDASIKVLAKEESDVSVVMARKSALLDRLQAEADNRDAGSPARVSNTRGMTARGMRYRLAGNNLWLVGNGQPGWAPFGDWGSEDAFDGLGWY